MRGLVFMLGMSGMLSIAIARPIAGVLIYYWISLMSPQTEVWGVAQTVPWALMAAIATLVGCVVAREPRRLPMNGMVILVIAFMILSSIASVFALGPTDRVIGAWSGVMKDFLFLLVTFAVVTDRRRIQALIWMMVISLGFYGVVGGAFAIVTAGADHVFGPPNSIIGDNNQLALALLVTLPLMNYLRQHSAHRLIRGVLGIAMLLTFLSILASYSRGALIGLACISLFFWLKSRRKIVSAVIVAAVLAGGFSFMPAKWVARMDSIHAYHKDASAEERLHVWREALGIATARPLVGGGYKSTATPSVLHQFYPDARPLAVHSIWFEVLSENGFPAFFVWLAMTGLGVVNIRRITRAARERPDLDWMQDFARMAQVSMIAYLSAGSFLSMGYYNLYFLILAILSIMVDLLARDEIHLATRKRTFSVSSSASLLPSWRNRRVSQ